MAWVSLNRNSTLVRQRSRLNPFAREWNPSTDGAPLENRSLFITFSYGLPLTKEEIHQYFTRTYGDWIEDIYVHYPRNGGPPEFAKIHFKTLSARAIILGNREQVKVVVVNGRPLLLKKFKPRTPASS